MNQVEVDVVESHAAHALLDGEQRLVMGVVAARQLGSDDDVFTRHTGFADSAAHHAFVLIVEGGIDESVA